MKIIDPFEIRSSGTHRVRLSVVLPRDEKPQENVRVPGTHTDDNERAKWVFAILAQILGLSINVVRPGSARAFRVRDRAIRFARAVR